MRRLVSPVLVARDDELALIASAAARAAEGTPSTVIVGGEAGIGKTRLVDAAAERLEEEGFAVLRGSCVELGGEALPFAPLADAVRALARSLDEHALDDALGPARAMLARLLPELEIDGPATEIQPGRFFELVLGMLGRLAEERPLAFVVEDAHWADQGTLDLIAFLVRALRGVRVLLVVTYRSDELHRGHPLRRMLAELERVRSVERLELRRFTRTEVAEQLAAIRGEVPPADVVDLVHERSEGNAFLVEEMLAVVESGGAEVPPSLRDVLLARLEQLSEPAQRVLRVAATGGGRVSEELLAAVSGLAEQELLAGLREAVENHLLVVDDEGAGYRFRHALARDAVYEDLLPGERVRLHGRFGSAIEASPSLAGVSALAWHWYAALDLPRALEASVRAAREGASGAALPEEVARHCERALEVWDRVPDAESLAGVDHVGLLELALQATIASGQEARTLTHAVEALAELDPEQDPRRTAHVLYLRSEALRRLRRDPFPDLDRAAGLLGDEPVRELANVLAGLANAHIFDGNDEQARTAGLRAVEVARTLGAADVEANALISLGGARSYLGDVDGGAADVREGLAIATRLQDPDTCVRAHIVLSDTFEVAQRHEEAIAEAEAGIAIARRHGLMHSLGVFLAGNQAESLVRLGRFDEAAAVLDDALSNHADQSRLVSPRLMRAELLLRLGRSDEARADAAATRALLGDEPTHQYQAHLCLIEAELARSAGDHDAARTAIDRGLPEGEPMLGRYVWPLVWAGLRIEAESGEPDAQRVEALRRRGERLDPATQPAQCHRPLVAAEAARAEGADDPELWEAAVAAARS
ncbi:MAG TPA: AAA family ATPase, partial [Gaiellaceae bacterium]|nr:AAA family ATPase [Gaiellaceae bacterium]